MKLSTEIPIEPMKHRVVYGDGMLFLGSCFADEIGNSCKGLGFNAVVNPFGVLYNPLSIANALHRLQSGTPFSSEEVIQVGEEYYCTFSHNTNFWNPTKEGLLNHVNKELEESSLCFKKAQWVIISLGTAWVFRFQPTMQVVANCHKMPSRLFERFCLSLPQTIQSLSAVLEAHPDKEFIFTVSPLRHLKDGLHGNQLSKATLLLAVEQLCNNYQNAHYFPAYEILLDELRDYRFYKEDMVHPTEQAIRYIWERFVDFAIDPSEQPAMKDAAELKQMLQHRPMFPESEAFNKFELMKEKKIDQLKRNFPMVSFENISLSQTN